MIDTEALRKKVIDLAIQGKLTEQLPEDGDARDLYAQIQEEKAKLIKEGKIKKQKALPVIEDDEIPFEIPKNWMSARIGDVCLQITDAGYGSDFYKTVSSDLKRIFPDIGSFSPTNLKYMRYFYEMYPSVMINRPQPVDDLHMIFQIPWGHNRTILDKCKGNPEKALFYVKKTLENNWSRAVLVNFLDTDLYEREGKAVTNFNLTLPEEQSDLAQAITKDPYNFDFNTDE